MGPVKVVLRYVNGRVIKGFTQDFSPNKDRFHLYFNSQFSGKPMEVVVKELKAVFFVRDFIGNSQYHEQKNIIEREKTPGQELEVMFVDDEVLVGATLAYDQNRPGFFLIPADPKSNNSRVFVVFSAVRGIHRYKSFYPAPKNDEFCSLIYPPRMFLQKVKGKDRGGSAFFIKFFKLINAKKWHFWVFHKTQLLRKSLKNQSV